MTPTRTLPPLIVTARPALPGTWLVPVLTGAADRVRLRVVVSPGSPDPAGLPVLAAADPRSLALAA